MDTNLNDFSISTWYFNFKSVTIHTEIVKIPENVLKIITAGIYQEKSESLPELDEFIINITQAIKNVGGKAFIKNNWHAPKDARWISLCNDLLATSYKDVLLYLSASDRVTSDFRTSLSDMYYCVALKPWLNIHPASEFRCIVINNILWGITPRDWPMYYKYFVTDGPDIIRDIKMFFTTNIKNRFFRKEYLFDVVVQFPRTVHLIDFEPLAESSVLHAFNWQEIKPIINRNEDNEVEPVFRFLEEDMWPYMHCDPNYL